MLLLRLPPTRTCTILSIVNGVAVNNPVLRVSHDPFRVVKTGFQSASDDQALNLDITVFGLGPEIAAERSFGIELINRRMKFAALAHQDRFVVGQKLGKQAEPEQNAEDHQRPCCAPVAAKVANPALVQG